MSDENYHSPDDENDMHKDIKATPSIKFSTGSNKRDSSPQVHMESPVNPKVLLSVYQSTNGK